MKVIDKVLARYEGLLMECTHTNSIQQIIDDYDTDMKYRRDFWNTAFSKYNATESKKKKEEPLVKGRFIVADVNFIGRDRMTLVETACAVISTNKDRITVLAHMPYVRKPSCF